MTTLPDNIPFKISTSDPVASISGASRIVIGQLGQTLDGCIATESGDSKYINSDSGLKHLHRVRSAVDAVIIGVGSVNADDPKLTVRLCDGSHPIRVVIDPNGRVDAGSFLFRDESAETIIVTSEGTDHPLKSQARILQLPSVDGKLNPKSIVSTLNASGYRRLLVEGGNRTLSCFMDAGILDRLHLIVAPVIMGSGKQGLQMVPIDRLHEALRPEVTLYPLGQDILFDCNFDIKNSN